ncbi:DEAD/DEAH box helicase family protein, partial [Mycobacterium tuberculosis]|nr:DEAD/DEAH box helicase family protein [Mycobacterium tuberculosis]
DQEAAAETIRAAFHADEAPVFLLDGVTGSGKTEVYFEAAAAAFAAGRQVLILLPEIALTSQFIERFTARFGVKPGEWHSDVTPKN